MTQSAIDRQMIIDAVGKYAFGFDQSNFGLMADAFAKEATSGGKISGTDMAWGPMIGREAIASGLEGMRKSQSFQPRHSLSSFVFAEQSATQAKLTCYLSLLTSQGGKAGLATCGWLDIEAVKEKDVWRLSRLDVTLDAPF